MASEDFSTASEAFGFLKAERESHADLAQHLGTFAAEAKGVLRTHGTLVYGQNGLYGGRAGVIGSAHRGVRVRQATEIVEVHDGARIALADPEQEDDKSIHLVTPHPSFYRDLKADTIARIGGEKQLDVPGVPIIGRKHLDAARLLLQKLVGSLEPVTNSKAVRHLGLPKVVMSGYFPADEVINLRNLDRKKWPIIF